MTPRRILPSLLAATCLAFLSTAAAAQEAPVFERQYELEFLDTHAAAAVAQNQCPPVDDTGRCRVAVVKGSLIVVRADADTQERVAAALAERDVPPASQAFQVSLLRADRSGSGTPGDLPPAVAGALEDVRPFLPYTGYEMLDAAFLRTTESGGVEMSGPDGRVYEAFLAFQGTPEDGEDLFVKRFVLEEKAGALRPPRAEPAGTDESETVAPLAPSRTALSTSFSIAPGETVVVGTSRLGGGQSALVVLVTAMP